MRPQNSVECSYSILKVIYFKSEFHLAETSTILFNTELVGTSSCSHKLYVNQLNVLSRFNTLEFIIAIS